MEITVMSVTEWDFVALRPTKSSAHGSVPSYTNSFSGGRVSVRDFVGNVSFHDTFVACLRKRLSYVKATYVAENYYDVEITNSDFIHYLKYLSLLSEIKKVLF